MYRATSVALNFGFGLGTFGSVLPRERLRLIWPVWAPYFTQEVAHHGGASQAELLVEAGGSDAVRVTFDAHPVGRIGLQELGEP